VDVGERRWMITTANLGRRTQEHTVEHTMFGAVKLAAFSD
jgi:hypothetical protein